jgi:hypothetical protein
MPTQSGDRKDTNKDKGTSKNKVSETLTSLKKSENIDNLMSYAKTHIQDTVAYILLVSGIIWIFFNSFYGGILVGLIAGFYFAQEVLEIINSFDRFLDKKGMAKNLILAGTLLALFILAPGIFIGAAIMVGVKYLLKSEK